MGLIIKVIFLGIIGLFLYGYLRNQYIQSKQKADFLRIFGDWKTSMPTLEFGSSYAWPFLLNIRK